VVNPLTNYKNSLCKTLFLFDSTKVRLSE